MATIVDIAKASGYSVSTVSYALHDAKNISKATKEKIWQIAKQLKYYPNAAARNLKNRKTHNIGLFISGFSGPVYHKIYEGIAHVINQTKYNLLISFWQNAKKMISERQIDAAIILCPLVPDSVIELSESMGIPVYVLDRRSDDECKAHSHVVDSYHGAYKATEHLVNQGYQRIAYLSGIPDSQVNLERQAGYIDALRAGGIEKNDLIYTGDFTEKSGAEVVKNLEGKFDFDAIFCANDEMAIGFISACQSVGVKIPEDVAVIGFDDVEVGKYIAGGMSTIKVDQYSWGLEVANDLLQILQGKKIECQKIVATELVIRKTT
ncbi:MAG: LacI family DNA-binding transcriptional regulator [Bacilli bacterium]|nr:LacI family DNA-binding transcriptional regulator [Bacilli bacterium]